MFRCLRMSALKVLVVNDSGLVGSRLVAQLEGLEGVEVLPQAFNAIQASLALKAAAPGLVLLDPQLAAGTSRGLLRDIKRRLPDTRVVVLAPAADDVSRRAWLEAGAHDYVTFAADIRALVLDARGDAPSPNAA